MSDIADRARELTNQILGGSGDYLQIHVKAAFDVDIKNTDETTALIAAALQRERDEKGYFGLSASQDFSAEEEGEYCRVIALARDQAGTNSALDILYRMGYWRAVKDRSNALARAANAEREAKALREALEVIVLEDGKGTFIDPRYLASIARNALARAALQSQGGE
jgi:hypothetical protein